MKKTAAGILYVDRYSYIHGGGQIYLEQLVRGIDRTRFNPFVLLPAQGELSGMLSAAGATVRYIQVPGYYNVAGFCRAIRDIAGVCRRDGIEIIHCNTTSESVTLAALIAARICGIPSVWQLHIAQRSPARDRLLALLADSIVCVSRYCGEHRFPWLRGNAKLSYVINGIDTARFAANPGAGILWRKEQGIPEGACVIAALSQLTENKGQSILLNAFIPLAKKYAGLSLVLAGRDISPGKDFAPKLQAKVSEHGLETRVLFTDWTDRTPDILNAADITVIPSIIDHFPLAILEAMACGKAVVASNIAAFPEAVEEGVTGKLVPPGDAGALEKALERLVVNAEERMRMGKEGRRKAEKSFSIAMTVQKMEEVYARLLRGRP